MHPDGCDAPTCQQNHPLLAELVRLRRRLRLLALLEAVSLVVTVALGGAVALIGLDYLLRLSSLPRTVASLAWAAGCVWLAWRRVRPAATARVDLLELALRLSGRLGPPEDRLANAVALMHGRATGHPALIVRAIGQAAGGVQYRRLRGALRVAAVGPAAAGLAVAAAASVLPALRWPELAWIGLQRLVWPAAQARWPRRVQIEPLTGDAVVALGEMFRPRMRVTRGYRPNLRARLHLQFDDGRQASDWLDQEGGGLYSRTYPSVVKDFSYWFEAGDASTSPSAGHVHVAARPAVSEVLLSVTLPTYLRRQRPRRIWPGPAPVELLVGSQVELIVRANKPLDVANGRARARLIERDGSVVCLEPLDGSGRVFAARWTVRRDRSFRIELVDRYGLSNRDQRWYRLVARSDRPPRLSILRPQGRVEVTPEAVVELLIAAEDDFGIESVALVARPRGRGQPVRVELGRPKGQGAAAGPVSVRLTYQWRLGPLDLRPGDVVLCHVEATDNYAEQGGRHRPGRSEQIELRVVSPSQFARRLREQAMRIAERLRGVLAGQQQIYGEAGGAGSLASRPSGQAAELGARLSQLAERQWRLVRQVGGAAAALGGLARLADRNLGHDTDLAGRLWRLAGELDGGVKEAMGAAGRRLEQAGLQQAPAGRTEDLRQGRVHQQEAISRLRAVLEQMDRWGRLAEALARARGLLEQQGLLVRRTGEAAGRLLGRRADELGPQEAALLAELSRQQDLAAEELNRLCRLIRAVGRSLGRAERRAAEALRRADELAETGRLAERMGRAGRLIAANRLARASREQLAAATGLQQVVAAVGEGLSQLGSRGGRARGGRGQQPGAMAGQGLADRSTAAGSGGGEQARRGRRVGGLAPGGPVGQEWGWPGLPVRDRQEVVQGRRERWLGRYRRWIERYYRALAEAGSW